MLPNSGFLISLRRFKKRKEKKDYECRKKGDAGILGEGSDEGRARRVSRRPNSPSNFRKPFAYAAGDEPIRRASTTLEGRRLPRLEFDMRLLVKRSGLYAYPDVQVVSGAPEFADEANDTLLNPKAIVEVLSDNSAAWDQGGKFWHYRQLDSLAEYLLVSHRTWLVDHYVKQSGGVWMLKTVEGKEGALQLMSAKCQLPLSEIYGNTGVSSTATPTTAL